LICTGSTDSCLRHLQFAQPFKLAESETDIACYLPAFFADTTINGIKISATDTASPGDYVFLILHIDQNQRGGLLHPLD
jgi:hypothetical protein